MRLFFVALAAMMLLPHRASALDPARDVLQYDIRTWNRQNGLPANTISALAQDRQGYLWLGTQVGLVRFDGVRFSSVAFPPDAVYGNGAVASLSAARDGGLWFGLSLGRLGRLDENHGVTLAPPSDVEGSAPYILCLQEFSDGTLWLGTAAGLMRHRPDSPAADRPEPGPTTVRNFARDSRGRVWLAAGTEGLHYWLNGTLHRVDDESLRGEQVVAVAADQEDKLWVGTSRGLRGYTPDLQLLDVPAFPHDVRTLLADRRGSLWIGTAGDGLARLSKGEIQFIHRQDGLAHNVITSLLEDREGSLWVGTREGVTQLADVKFPLHATAQGLPSGACHAVSPASDGGLWIATNRGVSRFDGHHATNYTDAHGLSHPYIKRAFEARDGDVYLINGQRGIDILAGDRVVATFDNDRWPTAFAEDAEGMIVAVGDVLHRIDRNGLRPYVFGDTGAPDLTWIRNLLVARDGSLWIAAVDGVLHVVNGRVVRHWTTADGLSSNDTYTLCEDGDGHIWAGLMTGLARIAGDNIRSVRRRDGLPDESIFALVPDDHGHLWANSNRGVFRVSLDVLHAFCDGRADSVRGTAYDGADAVKTTDSSDTEYVGCKTRDGQIWFPTPLGALSIDPARILANPVAPPVVMENVRANAKVLAGAGPHVVPPGAGDLEFVFAALTFVAPQQVRFRYRLDGYEKEWNETDNRRFASYTNLKPGRYTFRVTAANADGVWSEHPASVEFRLQPRFHQTVWFRILAASLAIGALAGLYVARINRLKHRERALRENRARLESEVRERTADLHREMEVREKAQAALRASEAFLQSLLQNLPVHIVRTDLEGRLVFANRLFCDLLRLPSDQILGKTHSDLLPPAVAARARQTDLQVIESDHALETIEELPAPEGSLFFQMIKVPAHDAEGRKLGVQAMFIDVTARIRSQAALEQAHRELVDLSRRAGMAEIATSVLHNVGNVLNSLNVSATLVAEQVRQSKAGNITRLAELVDRHRDDLAGFLVADPRGRMIPDYLNTLSATIRDQRKAVEEELGHLQKHIDHIREIVSTQQSYARSPAIHEIISVPQIIENALQVVGADLERQGIELVREIDTRPSVRADRHKILQILISLLRNAGHACSESGHPDKRITVRVASDDTTVSLTVTDNGVGIAPENIARIFAQGAPAQKGGHGLGLHDAANAAYEAGASLTARSDGIGRGASFVLVLPLPRAKRT